MDPAKSNINSQKFSDKLRSFVLRFIGCNLIRERETGNFKSLPRNLNLFPGFNFEIMVGAPFLIN